MTWEPRDRFELLAGARGDANLPCAIELAVDPQARTYKVTASVEGLARIEADAGDAFEALRRVRRELERHDVLLNCAGARRDVWASGTQRDMGGGLHAYVLEMPRTETRPSTIGIFEPVPPELAATVEEQDEFYTRWLQSKPGDTPSER
jgi:hypothetical protein